MINIRRVGYIFNNSVTTEKLADAAITTPKLADAAIIEQKIAPNAVTDIQIADNSVVETKIASLSISTEKLKDNVVTLAKSDNDVKTVSFLGDETEVNATGLIEVGVKNFNFSKSSRLSPNRMRIIATLKTNDITKIASFLLYINGEGTPRVTLTSTSLTYELVSDDFDISSLANGKHSVTIKMKSSAADGIAYNDYFDCILVK